MSALRVNLENCLIQEGELLNKTTTIKEELARLREERDKLQRQIDAWEDLLALEARLAKKEAEKKEKKKK